MMYKGYEIKKVTKCDWIIYKEGKWSNLNGDAGCFPKTLKEAKARIDSSL